MCGIAGWVDRQTRAGSERLAQKMGQTIGHRGPDDAGVWKDDAASVVLLHRRLSVLDPSTAGRQPMLSACGRYVLVFKC